jgi:hypothetical protein
MGSTLPLLGLEFKLLSLVILLSALVWLLRRISARGGWPLRSSRAAG